MTKAWLNSFWQLGVVSSLATCSAITPSRFVNALPEAYVLAQIQPDSTLGSESSVVTVDTNSDRIDGGAIRSNNLLHSFQEFNVDEGKAVYFANPQGIENIFSRVTGNNPSQIRGALGVLGAANLLLLNPNGIIFGENASLDVNGSFVATTAESILFENGQEFSAINPQKPILEIKVPLGLQIGNTPGAIVNRARTAISDIPIGLIVDAGKSLSLVGGDINLNGGILNSLGGRIELGGLSASGEIKINRDGSLSFPNDVARADVSLSKEAFVNVAAIGGGEIIINAKNLKLAESSGLRSGIDIFGIRGVGRPEAVAGDITINTTEEISLAQGSGILNQILEDNLGKAGNINIQTSSLKLTEGSLISTATIGKGDAGNIKIDATDNFSADNSLIFSVAAGNAEGDSGNTEITTNNLTLTNRNEIRTAISDRAKGNGGNIKIKANNIFADRSIILSGVAQLAVGNAGGIEIDTSNLTLANESLIDNSTLGKGDGGNLNIVTRNLILNNSQISSSTDGTGNAGKIDIDAIDLISAVRSIIFSGVGEKAQGNGGEIDIKTSKIFFNNGAQLNTESFGVGNAGNIKVSADSFTLDRGSSIFASNTPSAAISFTLSGGNITLQIADRLTLRNNSDISTQASSNANGGNIDVTANAVIAFDDSDIFAFAQEGRGGNITLNTPAYFGYSFNPSSSQIKPNSSNNFLNGNNRADINATGAVSGVVTIPDVSFIQNSLTELPENPIDTNALIANSCIARRERGGTFTVTGAGGLPSRPGNAAVSPYPTGDVRGVESDRTSNNSTHRPWKIGDPIVEPQAAYRLANGQMVLSRECER